MTKITARHVLLSKRLSIVFLIVICSIKIYSQPLITGRILDSSRAPIPYIPVALVMEKDSMIYKGVITGESGYYHFEEIKAGKYLIKIVAMGFDEKYSTSFKVDSNSKIELPDIELDSKSHNLKEISVSAVKRTVEFKDGNIIVNVANSALAKGNSVYDLLHKLPGVAVNSNEISLEGKSGVIVMIDGRPQTLSNQHLMNILKSMSAELIDKIEVLKNPPVKYDASGTSGMINIITKETSLLGISGNIYISASQGFYGNVSPGAGLNYKSKKISLFSDINYYHATYRIEEIYSRNFALDSGVTEFEGLNTHKGLHLDIYGKIGADWFVDDKNILGFTIEGGPGSYLESRNGTNTIHNYNDLGFDHLRSKVSSSEKWNYTNCNFNAEHLFDTNGTVLSFSSDYTDYSEPGNSIIENYFLDANNNQVLPPNIYRTGNKVATEKIFVSKLDFVKALNKTSSFETGIKASFINTFNNYLFERKDNATGVFYTDTAFTNNYNYQEENLAAYLNYRREYKKLNFSLGLRAENTNLKGVNPDKGFELSNNYINFFPNVSFDYEKSANHNFQLNLNRRIDRPSYYSLSPFKYFRDQYSYNEGNPLLLPHYSNNIGLTYGFKDFIFNTFSYSQINGVMSGFIVQNDTSKVLAESRKNMEYRKVYTYSVFMEYALFTWWELSANGVFSYLEFKGDNKGIPFNTASPYHTGFLTNTILLSKNTKLEINTIYRSPRLNATVFIKAKWMISLALKKAFLNEKLDCTIGIEDIFYTMFLRSSSNFDNQDWNYRGTYDTRRLKVSVSYNFGKVKIEQRERSSNEEELDRID